MTAPNSFNDRAVGRSTSSRTTMLRHVGVATATILSGASLSDVIDLGGAVLSAIMMPAAWTTAALSFQASDTESGTFYDVYDDSNTEVLVSSSAAAAQRVLVSDGVIEQLAPLRFIKIRSGATGAAVAQGADRTITLLLKG